MSYPELLTIELARLDKLQRALWPLTQPRRQTLDDGSQITLEPDPKAVDTVLRVMQQRSKLMGMEVVQTLDLTPSTHQEQKPTLHGAPEQEDRHNLTPEEEAKQLIRLSLQAGILDEKTAKTLLEADDIIEAEVVEE